MEPSPRSRNLGMYFYSSIKPFVQKSAAASTFHIRSQVAISVHLHWDLVRRLCAYLMISSVVWTIVIPSSTGFQSACCAHFSLPSRWPLTLSTQVSIGVNHLLKDLRWLPIERRIEKNISTITFKARNVVAPSHLAELLRDYTPVRALRSSDFGNLAVITFKLRTVGDRSFVHQHLELVTLFHLLFVQAPSLY